MNAAIIQARLGSTRLPGKVLKKIGGMTLLEILVARLKKSNCIDKIIIATTNNSCDNDIVRKCHDMEIDCFRGAEDDVLDRYYQAAKKYDVQEIVRITSDCPLADPFLIDKMWQKYQEEKCDYIVNTLKPGNYSDGFDVEIFSFSNLELVHREATLYSHREHVTFYFWKIQNKFKIYYFVYNEDLSSYRFTVDYEEDFVLIEKIIGELKRKGLFGSFEEIIEIMKENSEWEKINAGHYLGEGWADSLKKDKQIDS